MKVKISKEEKSRDREDLPNKHMTEVGSRAVDHLMVILEEDLKDLLEKYKQIPVVFRE